MRKGTLVICVAVLWAIFVWWPTPGPYAAEDVIEVEAEAEAEPVKVFKDSVASKKLCVAADITKESGTVWQFRLKQSLAPGLYRATFVVRVFPIEDPITKGLEATASAAGGVRRFSYLNATGTERYAAIPVLFEMRSGGRPDFALSWTHDKKLYQQATGDHLAGAGLKEIAPKSDLEGEVSEPAAGEGDEVIAELQEGRPLKEAGRAHLAIDKLRIECVSRTAMITRIYPDKIHYAPGEDSSAEVALFNFSDRALEGEVSLEMIQEIDQTRPLGQKKVSLAPAKETTTRFDFNVGPAEFGRELRATLVLDGRPVDRKSEYFGVSRQVWQVAICGQGAPHHDAGLGSRAAEAMAHNRRNYCNWFECFAWAPSDFDDMTPDTEEFWSGQTQYHKTRTDLKAYIDEAHKHGIKAISYGKSCGGGVPGFECLRKHRDWYWVAPIGFGIEGGPDLEFLDRMRAKDYGSSRLDSFQSWQGTWVNSSVRDAVVYGSEEIVRSTDMFGWDGVRWDGHFCYGGDEKGDEITAANTRLCKEIVAKKYPNFLWGYNYGEPLYADREALAKRIPVRSMFGGSLKDYEETCSGGGLLMDEGVRDFSNRNFSDATMSVFGEAVALEADWVHNLGGYYLCIGFDSETQLDRLYNQLFFLAVGARPYGSGGATTVGHPFQFATRYSAYIYDNSRRRIKEPEKFITVTSPEPLWWKPYVWIRKTEKGAQLLIHIISEPGCKAFNDFKQPPPKLQKDVPVTVALPDGWRGVRAAQLSLELEGYQRLLGLVSDGQRLTTTLPDHHFYSLVVFELARTKDDPVPFPLDDPVNAARRAYADAKRTAAERQAKAAAEKKPEEKPEPPKEPPKPLSDAEIQAMLKLEIPKDATLRRNGWRDIVLANGVYHHMYRVPEAIGWAGGATVRICNVRAVGGQKPTIKDFPSTLDQFLDYDVIVLNNAPLWISPQQVYLIRKFVELGGGLLVIGGEWSLNRGGVQGSYLEDVLPVTLGAPTEMKQLPGGVPLVPTEEGRQFGALDWGAQPHVFSFNAIAPKPGARVLVKGGDLPALITGTYGSGRVAVFAVSTHGEVPEGKLAFWDWEGLVPLLAGTIDWLAQGYEEVYKAPAPQIERDKLLETLISLNDLPKVEDRDKIVLELCSVCDKEVASALLSALAAGVKLSSKTYERIAVAIHPYVDETMLKEVEEVSKLEDNREAQAIGVGLLGLAGGKKMIDTLAAYLDHNDTAVQRAAALALGDLRSPEAIKPLKAKFDRLGKQATQTDEQGTDEVAGVSHEILLALFKCQADSSLLMLLDAYNNAIVQAKRFERYKEALFVGQWGTAFKLTREQYAAWIRSMERAGQRRDWWLAEAEVLAREIRNVPEEAIDDFVKSAASMDAPQVVGLICRMLSKVEKPEQVAKLAPLVAAKAPMIRTMALRRIFEKGSEHDKEAARKEIVRLASAKFHLDRFFAGRCVRFLTKEEGRQVLDLLSKDEEPESKDLSVSQKYLVEKVP